MSTSVHLTILICFSLTGATGIFGEDRLFATLDTTLHQAVLPSRCAILLADTIGFISDLPIDLIASFEATLCHVVNADLLIHIEDLSHPNVQAQRENVMRTLQDLKIRDELVDSMIHVSNKVDKLSSAELETLNASSSMENNLLVSCRTGLGLSKLVDYIDKVCFNYMLMSIFISENSSAYWHENTRISTEARFRDDFVSIQ